jgi:hypothetical protein
MTKKMTLVIIIHETKLMLNDIHPNFYLQFIYAGLDIGSE